MYPPMQTAKKMNGIVAVIIEQAPIDLGPKATATQQKHQQTATAAKRGPAKRMGTSPSML